MALDAAEAVFQLPGEGLRKVSVRDYLMGLDFQVAIHSISNSRLKFASKALLKLLFLDCLLDVVCIHRCSD